MKDGTKKALLKVFAELYKACVKILIGVVTYIICKNC